MYSRANSINVKAKTMDEAVAKAAKVLGVQQKLVCYEAAEKGFLSSIFGSKIQINAWIKQADEKSQRSKGRNKNSGNFKKNNRNKKDASTSHDTESADKEDSRNSKGRSRGDRPRRGRKKNFQANRKRERVRIAVEPLENEPEVIKELQNYCLDIAKHVDPAVTEVETKREEERCIFNIKSEYIQGVLNKNIKIAESFEHLLRKKPRHLKQDLPFRIFVDADDARISRENELIEMAADLSRKVTENGRPIVLNYRSAYDRKIIHMALDKDDSVYTKSVGTGSDRRLMILPADGEAGEATEGVEHAES